MAEIEENRSVTLGELYYVESYGMCGYVNREYEDFDSIDWERYRQLFSLSSKEDTKRGFVRAFQDQQGGMRPSLANNPWYELVDANTEQSQDLGYRLSPESFLTPESQLDEPYNYFINRLCSLDNEIFVYTLIMAELSLTGMVLGDEPSLSLLRRSKHVEDGEDFYDVSKWERVSKFTEGYSYADYALDLTVLDATEAGMYRHLLDITLLVGSLNMDLISQTGKGGERLSSKSMSRKRYPPTKDLHKFFRVLAQNRVLFFRNKAYIGRYYSDRDQTLQIVPYIHPVVTI